MFRNSESISEGSTVETDICVIGAGAAGITFAREFRNTSISVCVLESGQLQSRLSRISIRAYRLLHRTLNRFFRPRLTNAILKTVVSNFAHDPLYDLEYTHLPVRHESRRRAFGGSMIAWGGKWVRYNAIDFSKRAWVPHSGWPLTRDELDPYYERATASVAAPTQVTGAFDANFLGAGPFETVAFVRQQKELLNWGVQLRSDFDRSQNITVHTGAHVVAINKSEAHIKDVSVRTTQGNTYRVRARHFVLACGGIENARLLLISDVGNEHDQVGRYYMDHPMGRCGIITTRYPVDLSYYWGTHAMSVGFRLSDATQEKESILNNHVFLESIPDELTSFRKLTRIITRGKTSHTISIRNHLEQEPSRTNRVTLSDSKDPFGLPIPRISWSLSDLDKRSIVVLHQYLRDHVATAGIGELQSPLLRGDASFACVAHDAYHHMGTTRMGLDPKTSVVDANCRIHGFDNMFVMGSSVFPTSGSANPTATICALAVRLADYIKKIV